MTEIHLCGVCSCREILRRNGADRPDVANDSTKDEEPPMEAEQAADLLSWLGTSLDGRASKVTASKEGCVLIDDEITCCR
eukprot:COSAG01_NODE_10898_length_2056_cov_1.557486_2_plen_80_part_00